MLSPGFIAGIGIIFVVLVLNFFFMLRHVKRAGKSRGRKYVAPEEKKQIEWRDKEIARRLEREQEDALDRVTLRNETLSYYELVRKKYEKKEALERLGIKVEDEELDGLKSIPHEEDEELKYRDVRDDIYVLEDK